MTKLSRSGGKDALAGALVSREWLVAPANRLPAFRWTAFFSPHDGPKKQHRQEFPARTQTTTKLSQRPSDSCAVRSQI